MKRGKKKFNISNKLAYTLIAISLIILLGIGVYAYGGTSPAVMGHSMGELMPSCSGILTGTANSANSWACIPAPPVCAASQSLRWTGSDWECKDISSPRIAIYSCPVSIASTISCPNVQLLRNGVPPCMGQLTTNSGSACFLVDNNCVFTSSFGTCDTLVGYLS